jgi:RNA polymerase sigma-54 factor
MKLGFDLNLEQSQKLVMTPELIQAIQILQYNAQDLEKYIDEQLLTNPILEVDNTEKKTSDDEFLQSEQPEPKSKKDEEFDWSEYLKEMEYDDISYRSFESANKDDQEYNYEQFTSSEVSLSEHLMFQLQFSGLKRGCRQVGKYIIDSLDPNGYLTQSREDMANHLNVPLDKIDLVVDTIQGFEPVGVASQDLKECLLVQLHSMGYDYEETSTIVCDHLEDLAANRLALIAKKVNMTVEDVQELADVIKSLEPKPGRQFSSSAETRYVVPDVIIDKYDDEYIITVNESSVPHLVVSPYYKKILSDADKDSNISQFLTGRLNSALWLIKSIEQRRQTIYNVVKAILKYQMDFFEKGRKHLKPLTLKKIADDVGIHESTVSRSINGKYTQTPMGMFEIKYFFTSGVSSSEEGGLSSESIKAFIKEMVDEENPENPCSDQNMAEKLKAKGIDISRRTVAKYRDEMGILSSSKRRRY